MKHHILAYMLCLLSFFNASNTYAFNIRSWFENANQRATRLMDEKKFTEAKKTFTDPNWQAVATYRGKDYATAGTQFKARGDSEGFYNQGNALAYQEKYQEAIQAYDKTLKLNPKHSDAKHNRDLLKQHVEDQPPQSSNQNQDQDQEQQEQQQKQQSQQHDQKQSQDQKQEQQSQPQDQQQEPQEQEPAQQAKAGENNPEKEQWLRLIPDDPGGLLREKFWRDHYRRKQGENA